MQGRWRRRGVFFPTVPIEDEYPAAEIEGRLVVEDGCIYVTASDEAMAPAVA